MKWKPRFEPLIARWFLMATMAAASLAHAQSPTPWPDAFNPIADQLVYAIGVQPDGKVLVGTPKGHLSQREAQAIPLVKLSHV